METVQRCDNGWVRVIHGAIMSGGHQQVVHLASKDDASDVHRRRYDFDCSWCYLGATHSIAAHIESISTHLPSRPAAKSGTSERIAR